MERFMAVRTKTDHVSWLLCFASTDVEMDTTAVWLRRPIAVVTGTCRPILAVTPNRRERRGVFFVSRMRFGPKQDEP
jgi:hypothetical protein